MDGKVSVHMVGGQIHHGVLYAVDPVTHTIVLKIEEGSFSLIMPSQISKIDGDLSKLKVPDISGLGINLNSIEKNEMRSLDMAEKRLAAVNNNVSPEVQTLFDRLAFIFPSEWKRDNSIVVLEEFLISPPYETVESLLGTDGPGLDRVVKLLAGERKKLNMI